MARRVFLHIGTMKSATTYIQQLCELHADHLAASGVLWARGERKYRAVRDLFGRELAGDDATGDWAALARAIRRHSGDVVISNELLAAGTTGKIRRLVRALPNGEAHVIITARDLARSIPSHWQTTIKNGRTHTWSEFAAAVCMDWPLPDPSLDEPPEDAANREAAQIYAWFWRRHDLLSIVARWQRFVPAERISIVTVPPPGGDREGVARRFGSVIGVDLVGLPQPTQLSNPSLGAHSAELMRRLNGRSENVGRLEQKIGYRAAMGGALAVRASEEPIFALSPAQQDWVMARAHKVNAEIEGLGVRVEGDLADLVPAASPPAGAVDPSATTDVELLGAASHALIAMAETVTTTTLAGRQAAAKLRSVRREDRESPRTTTRQGTQIRSPAARESAGTERTPFQRVRVRGRSLLGRSRLLREVASRLRHEGTAT